MRDPSLPHHGDLPSRPRGLQLIDSAGVAPALAALAQARGVEIRVLDATGAPDPDSSAIRLQSVPATADEHWFVHVGRGFVPVRFHLPGDVAELVISAAQTEAQCSAAADVLVQLGLHVLLAPARPGLLVDRIRHAYLNEGLALLGEGVAAADVEQAGRHAGFVAGPLLLLDEQGLATTDQLYHQSLGEHHCCGHEHHHHGQGANHGHEHAHDDAHAHHGHGHGHGHNDHHPPRTRDGEGSSVQQSHDQAHPHDPEHDQAHAPSGSHAVHAQHEAHTHDHGSTCSHEHHHAHGHEHEHEHEHEHRHAVEPGSWPVLTEEAAYAMEKMAHGFQRKGRAAGGGFYDHDDDESGQEEAELWSGLEGFRRRGLTLPEEDLRDRLRFIPCVEVLQALSSRAMPSTTTASLAIRGAALWRDPVAEPLAVIAALGHEAFAQRTAELAERYGERFALPEGWQQRLPG